MQWLTERRGGGLWWSGHTMADSERRVGEGGGGCGGQVIQWLTERGGGGVVVVRRSCSG